MLHSYWLARGVLALVFLSGLVCGHAAEVTLPVLLKNSTTIAVIEITSTPPMRMEESAFDPKLFKQQGEAKLVQLIRGYLPETFQIENETNSTLTVGLHLAFMRRLEEGRYILSTRGSLRRIKGDLVYWFPHDYVPLAQALAEIK